MGPDRRFVCEVCAKPFKSLSNYHQHRLVHSNIRKFHCDICKSKSFKTKNHLKWVPPMHRSLSVKPISNFMFYRNHMRTHYAGDSIYSHLCAVCGNRYQNQVQKDNFTILRIHTLLEVCYFNVTFDSDKTGWTHATTHRWAPIRMRNLSQMYVTLLLMKQKLA